MSSIVCVAGLAALLAIPATVSAQETAASVYGRVIDAAGAPVAGVAVTARSADLISTIRTVTTTAGRYTFSALPPGSYVVSFTREGYVHVQRTLTLSLGETILLNVVMPGAKDAGAVVVDRDDPVFPPSWAMTLDSRHGAFDLQPVSGTLRTAIGLSVDPLSARPAPSLFLLDGLPLRHRWDFGPTVSFVGPGAEALQEATVLPGRLTTDYGRTDGSVLGGVSPSGTNRWSFGFRSTIGPADFNRDILPLGRETDGAATTTEYTAGGPLVRDRVWFFASGRHLSQSVANLTMFDAAPYATDTREDFGVARVTVSLKAGQRVEGQWIGARHRLTNTASGGGFLAGDSGGLEHRRLTDNAWSAAYIGTLSNRAQLTARYTREHGSDRAEEVTPFSILSAQTPLIDQATGVRWWSSGACAACDPRTATNDTLHATIGTAFGSHYVTAGADLARDDIRHAATPAGGSFAVRATRASVSGGVTYPVFAPNGSTWIVWQPEGERGHRARSDALFVQDRWSVSTRLVVDWGLRFDRNRVRATPTDALLLSEHLVSPRVFVTWKPAASQLWTLDAGFARYGVDAADRLDDVGTSSSRVFTYGGPAVNVGALTLTSGQALDSLFAWFQSAGGTGRAPLFAFEPGLSLQVTESRQAARVDEWSGGVSRTIGHLGYARADLAVRNYGGFSAGSVDPTLVAVDQFGQRLDVIQPVSTSLLERQYVSLSFRGRYRFGHYADVHAQYAWSRLTGSADDARYGVNALTPGALAYPEYSQNAWHLPTGSLADDVPHRFRLWAHSELMAHDTHGLLIVTVALSRESGRPYGAVGPVFVAPFVSNPGYAQPPVAVDYYFTGRDEFRTRRLTRTDAGISYRRRLPATVHGDLFVNLNVLNVFNKTRLLNHQAWVVTRTAFTDPSLQTFDPFTTTPMPNVHWTFQDADPDSTAAPRTLGRTFLLTLGVRF